MSKPTTTIIDYGMGNVRSLRRALERVGSEVVVTDDPAVAAAAERIAIPGQGAFGQAAERLTQTGLFEVIRTACLADRPVLGVCLGMQLLFSSSGEAPGVSGLGIIDASVDLLPVGDGVKRPHMGWSQVRHESNHPTLSANDTGEPFYFVHSYAAREAPGFEMATVSCGVEAVAAVARGRILGAQFHPEKSQDAGERMLAAWLALD